MRCLADHIGGLIDLTPGERATLNRIGERERSLRRGTVLLRENDRTAELYVLLSGTMMSYVLLDDGSRQILRFLFPGDLLATAAVGYSTSPETLVAHSESTVCIIDRMEHGQIERIGTQAAEHVLGLISTTAVNVRQLPTSASK